MQSIFTVNVNCAVILNSQLARNFRQTPGLPFFPVLPKLPSSSHHASVQHEWAGTSALPCPCRLPVETAILPWKGRQLPELFPSSLGVHRSDSEPQGGPSKWYLMHSLPWPFCCSCPVDCVCVVNQKITISQSSLIFVKCLWGKKKHKTIPLLHTRLWVIKLHRGLDERGMGWSLKRTEGSLPQAPRDSLSSPESSGKCQCCILEAV